jgi:hypothetical protein
MSSLVNTTLFQGGLPARAAGVEGAEYRRALGPAGHPSEGAGFQLSPRPTLPRHGRYASLSRFSCFLLGKYAWQTKAAL